MATMNRTIKVPFANPEHALIAKQVIEVDAELNPSAVKRTLSVDGENLIVYVPSFY
jgi:EKC/KEOPS complex subunit PCC1/LAGE3